MGVKVENKYSSRQEVNPEVPSKNITSSISGKFLNVIYAVSPMAAASKKTQDATPAAKHNEPVILDGEIV